MKNPIVITLAIIGGFLVCSCVCAGDPVPTQKPPTVPPAPTVTKQPTQTTKITPLQKTPVPTKVQTPQQTTPTKMQTPQQTTKVEEPRGLFARLRARREARRRELSVPADNRVEVRAPFTRVQIRR